VGIIDEGLDVYIQTAVLNLKLSSKCM